MFARRVIVVARLLIAVGLFFVLAGQKLSAAESSTRQQTIETIDSYVLEQMDRLHIPGIAIGIARGDQIAYVQGYGLADDQGRPVTPQTPFLIASLSKSVTALAIIQLVEEGKIDLDDPVQTYLPWFRVADENESSRITIRHLLYQTSGFSERGGYIRNLNTDPAENALETSVRDLSSETLNSLPGTAFEYSNTNYDLLGLVVQTVSGKSYESYIQERIFAPLEMKNSYTSLADARAGNMTSGYYSLFGFPIIYDRYMPYSRVTVPSAGLFASAEDMTHYLIAQLNRGRYQENTILSPGGMAELHAPAVRIGDQVSYAMGWVVFPFSAAVQEQGDPVPTAISHGGEWVGFRATAVLIPERELGVVVLLNQSDPSSGPAYSNLGWNIALLALGLEPVDFPAADFITRHGRWLLAGIILLLAGSMVWSARKIRLWSAQQGVDPRLRRKQVFQMGLLALVDLLMAGWLLFDKLPQDNDTLPLALHFNPDIGVMYVILLGLTLGWGLLRTVLFLVFISRTRVSGQY